MDEGRPALVIGFAAETDELLANAKAKFVQKGCDWIFANDVSPENSIMGGVENAVTLITSSGSEIWERMSKDDVAIKIVQKITETLGKG